jgi:hypothetical protein
MARHHVGNTDDTDVSKRPEAIFSGSIVVPLHPVRMGNAGGYVWIELAGTLMRGD